PPRRWRRACRVPPLLLPSLIVLVVAPMLRHLPATKQVLGLSIHASALRTSPLKYRHFRPKTPRSPEPLQVGEEITMSLIRSLRGQVLTLLGGSLLLMLLIALASFQALNDSARSYQRLLEGPATVSLRVASVNLDFKTQVQEWKNL